jgi:mycothiol system anti-sigma-R factor
VKPECEQALQDLERFLDGEMPEPARGLLDRHLNGCTPCMERADFKRHLKELIASRCGCDEVPASLQVRVAAVLEGSSPSEPHDA